VVAVREAGATTPSLQKKRKGGTPLFFFFLKRPLYDEENAI